MGIFDWKRGSVIGRMLSLIVVVGHEGIFVGDIPGLVSPSLRLHSNNLDILPMATNVG
jgi:hypothetical protein